ncbi:hypothetical protein V5F79_03260 [Xanthobacter flavus]|uniref:hypothetical protein n=1 Tax=Xanthobacter flavus TaxID=281 RepID=UPI00372A0AF1
MTDLLDGHVSLSLGGEAFTLAPTLGAAMALCRAHQSFGALIDKLEAYDLPAAIDVTRAGIGLSAPGDLDARVYAAGVMNIAPDLIRFVILLANGGRSPKAEAEDKPGSRPFDA